MSQTIAPVLGEATVQELREAVRGEILTPADDGYAEAARVWNGAHDGRTPALDRSLRRRRRRDAAAVGFARSNDLTIAVRGGGHSVAGFSTCDGGIVIDLSPMNDVQSIPPRSPRDGRRRCSVGRRRPRDAGPRPRDDRRPRLDDGRRAASRSAAASAGRCGSSGSRATTSSAPTSSPPTAGSCTRARPRTPTCSGACAAAAATSASSRGSSSSFTRSGRRSTPGRSSIRREAARDLLRVFRDWSADGSRRDHRRSST